MAQLLRHSRHLSGSFVAGESTAHFWIRALPAARSQALWQAHLVDAGLASPCVIGPIGPDRVRHLHARLSPFVPTEVAGRLLTGRTPDAAGRHALQLAAWSEQADQQAFAHHHRAAQAAGLPSLRGFAGAMPTTLVGIGRWARTLVMNLPPTAHPLAALAGASKATGRSVIAAHGLPVAPGSVAWGWQAAEREALKLGYPVVIKRPVSSNSDGVCTGLRDRAAVRRALRLLGAETDSYVVEKEIPGTEYRLHISAGRIVAVLEGRSSCVTGDGRSTLRELCESVRPGWLKAQLGNVWARRKLLLRLVSLGARSVRDIPRIVPPAGAPVAISPAVTVGSLTPVDRDVLHPEDRLCVERMLRALGSPGGGIDLILPEPGARLHDGGAILELNVPSGFGYLDAPEQLARDEIEAIVAATLGLREAGGRVPVHVIHTDDDPALTGRLSRTLEGCGGALLTPRPPFQWAALLDAPGATAFLLRLSDEALLEHGFPSGLTPIWHSNLDAEARRSRYPLLAAFMAQAGATDADAASLGV